jgi:aminopeptidase-like protein
MIAIAPTLIFRVSMAGSMNTSMSTTGTEFDAVGRELHAFVRELYPLCRSITGEGLRETLRRVQQHVPITLQEVPTGTRVFDWVIPREWNIRDAYVKNARGKRIIDFRSSNLHVVNYSVPMHSKMHLKELKPHLHSLPNHPEWIPYRTSYYKEDWGFCLSHTKLLELQDGEYEVCIDSTLSDGYLTYGELLIPGEISDEVLISCHSCHPSLCNDNLSGIVVATYLAKHFSAVAHRYSYRFLFIPGTIGAIAWLSRNEAKALQVKHGLVLACLGDAGPITYKRSRRGNSEIDRAAMHMLKNSREKHAILDFAPYGYDERQFCSPGFNLPVGSLSRTPWGRFPEYHTSADNPDFVKPHALGGSFRKCLEILALIESNEKYFNVNPKCEPQLGKRGLYSMTGGSAQQQDFEIALLWVLNQSDGTNSLLDIADKAGLKYSIILGAARELVKARLLVRCDGPMLAAPSIYPASFKKGETKL